MATRQLRFGREKVKWKSEIKLMKLKKAALDLSILSGAS